MSPRFYYIDPIGGSDAADGAAESRPRRTQPGAIVNPGDTVLFKRGSIIREVLQTRDGSPGAPITYGAYGTGPDPIFLGSISVGDASQWVQDRPTLWRYTGHIASEVGNLVFNDGASCGTLRWTLEEVREPGDWHYTGIGDACARESDGRQEQKTSTLFLCSQDNPGATYTSIEAVLWGSRRLVGGRCHLIFEHLSFRNSGVHGYQDCGVSQVTIRACDFRHIGGAVWNRELRIRFGNAIEFWDGATDILVEDCTFDDIYDSGVTHQGGENRNIPRRLRFQRNVFERCGMAAYECREPSSEVSFEHNICRNAGCGFSMLGVVGPRQSEIHPMPMGHHIFIWRIDPGTQPGPVYIRHNTFSESPNGSAIFSIIDPVDERWLILDHNSYQQTTGDGLIRLGGCDYAPSDFQRYQQTAGQDRNSRLR